MRQTLEEVMEQYNNSLYVAAFNICKSEETARDVVQDTFIKYYTTGQDFKDSQHLRAWLFRVAVNRAKDTIKTFWRKNVEPLDDYIETLTFKEEKDRSIFESVMSLPDKYRTVIHLYYYEDFSVREIARILRISESNVKIRLSRGRDLLKSKLKEDWYDD